MTEVPPFQLSDNEWYARLQASVEDTSLRLPRFPPGELQTKWIGSSGIQSLIEAFSFYRLIKKRADLRLGPILDFGCGYGRIIRFFLNDFPSDQLYGVDTQVEILEECRKTEVPGHFSHIDPMGKLPFPDRYFGTVYAYSVFTHLPEHVQDNWLAEIYRVLKRGGTLIATVEPPRVFDYFASIDLSDNTLHPWTAGNGRRIQTDPSYVRAFQSKGFAYLPGGTSHYGDAFMTLDYVRSHWGHWFHVEDFLDDASQFFQAVVIAKSF